MARVKPVIVVIEDDAKMLRLLQNILRDAGYEARGAASGGAGLLAAASRKPDLIILDLGLPDLDGADIIRKLREWWLSRPIIVLSGRDSEDTKVAALELGADDYITKPFGLPELLARVHAALRRTGCCSGGIRIGKFIDAERWQSGAEIPLPAACGACRRHRPRHPALPCHSELLSAARLDASPGGDAS